MQSSFIEEKEAKKISKELFDGANGDINELTKENLNFSAQESCIGNFKIDSNTPLSSFSTTFADAYAIASTEDAKSDENYALVFKKNLPIRLAEIVTFNTLKISGIILPKFYGITKIPLLGNEAYFVVIMPKPKGNSLKTLIDKGIKFDENFLTNKLLKPLLSTIDLLHNNSIMHGKINPCNIFIDDAGIVTFGEIISEAYGYSQLPFYETTELAQASKFGKGRGREGNDYYALGITLFALASGKIYADLVTKEIIKSKLYRGTYELLTNLGHVPSNFSTLIRGLVIDNAEQRWGFAEVNSALQGKIYDDKIVDKDFISRAIIFDERDFYSRKSLAFAMSQEWNLAREFVKTDKIKKWLQSSVSEEIFVEILHSMNFQIPSGKITDTKIFSIDDERLIRTLILIDPDSPIRINDIAFHKDGLGLLLINSLNSGSAYVLQMVAGTLISNLFSSFEYVSAIFGKNNNADYLKPIHKCIDYISRAEVGFGIDYCIYTLNPTLICQSHIVKEDFCLSGKDVLRCLEESNTNFEEITSKKTLAGFITSKLSWNTSYKIKELDMFHSLQKSKAFQFANIFAIAQKQFKVGSLNNLTLILRDALKEMLSTHIKSISIKNALFDQIDEATISGNIQALLNAAASHIMLTKNANGFAKAVTKSSEIIREIASYSQKDLINKQIRQKSLKIVLQCSYIICSLILVTIILRSI